MSNISFVILHYQAEIATKNAVNSVLQLYGEKAIVIVDNCSPNNSGISLKNFYANNSQITVLLNGENLSFARGNNIGFEYAKNILKADFIVLMNNDIVIEQKDFCQKFLEKFNHINYYVLSPAQREIEIDIQYVKPVDKFLTVYLIVLRVCYFFAFIHLTIFAKLLHKIFDKLIKKLYIIHGFAKPNTNEEIICAPRGSCMVLSPLFIKEYNGLDPRTTFYFEEWILFAKLFSKKQVSIYSPELQVFHNHNQSTKTAYPNRRNRLLFVFKNFIHGLKIYRSVLNEIPLLPC